MDSDPQCEPQLVAARRKERVPTLNAPGLIWLLIVVFLVLLGLAVSILGKPQDIVGAVPTVTEEPVSTDRKSVV